MEIVRATKHCARAVILHPKVVFGSLTLVYLENIKLANPCEVYRLIRNRRCALEADY